MKPLPELLAPAGSPRALEAAVAARADAVYFGGASHNARIGAHNFDRETMKSSVALAHAHGVKCYLTLNTLVTDRELTEVLDAAYSAAECGVDAFIVADLGISHCLRRYLPELPLHASTQASGHNTNCAAELEKLGFSRMVIARETSLDDIRAFTSSSSLELEVFVHGALCVSHSGQCLFSSLVGGRSGNRGECAQPCRLPFYKKNGREYYPLSLKDLCLAPHLPSLIDAGVASLKIEGRMKSPEYVFGVVSVWRRLLDERRAATPDEMKFLAECFSRGGFTDGYFTRRIGSSMLGVRSEEDKRQSRALPEFTGIKEKPRLDISAVIKVDRPVSLTVARGDKTVTVTGEPPQAARTAPMTREDYAARLSKLGSTPFSAGRVDVDADEGLMIPVSSLNALRREAVEGLLECQAPRVGDDAREIPTGKKQKRRTTRFALPEQIGESAKAFFDTIYLPLERYDGSVSGVVLPRVIFDSERERVEELLERAVSLGATDALVANLGHLSLAKKFGLIPHGDFTLNATNTQSVATLEKVGFVDVILSPELTLPQLRDIKGDTAAIVYGRIPLMTLEKCVICEASSCPGRSGAQACRAELLDRRGVGFPVLREGEHRSSVVNSLVTSMSDRQADLVRFGQTNQHFIFTTESAAEVDAAVHAFKTGAPLLGKVRRIGK